MDCPAQALIETPSKGPYFGPALPTPSKESANLDFLRTIAVLLVVFGHVAYFHGLVALGPMNLLSMGTLGVQLFFVHTCLVLMLSLERQWESHGAAESSVKFSVGFMIRRCFRIYPLSMAAVLLVTLFHLPLAIVAPRHFYGFKPDGGDLISSLFLVENLTHRLPILGPIWSLTFEMGMYLFLPCIFLLMRPNRSIWRIAAIWMLIIGFDIAVFRHASDANLALFAPCFLPGAIAYQIQRTTRPRLPGFLWPVVMAALVLLFFCFGYNWPKIAGQNWLKPWAACIFLGLAIPMFLQISSRWLVVASHLIAKYSYGIYLTHFFSIWFAFERLGYLPTVEKISLFAVLVTGLPVIFYHALEEPMTRLGKRVADSYARGPHPRKAVALQTSS